MLNLLFKSTFFYFLFMFSVKKTPNNSRSNRNINRIIFFSESKSFKRLQLSLADQYIHLTKIHEKIQKTKKCLF